MYYFIRCYIGCLLWEMIVYQPKTLSEWFTMILMLIFIGIIADMIVDPFESWRIKRR